MRYSWKRHRKQWGNAYYCYPYSIKIQAPLTFAFVKHLKDKKLDNFKDGTIVRVIKLNNQHFFVKDISNGLEQYVLEKDLLQC